MQINKIGKALEEKQTRRNEGIQYDPIKKHTQTEALSAHKR